MEISEKSISRSEFIVRTLATGFALAVSPACSSVITTSSKDLITAEVSIPVKDGKIPAYMACPNSGSNFPIVLVVQEIFGVHEHIKDVCRRFAKLGYYAIATELYARQGDVSQMTDFKEIFSKVVSKVPDSQVLSDLDATVEYAKSTGKVNVIKLAITGFCWGGRITWLYSAHNKNVKAAGAWYGRLVGEKSENQPEHPIDIAKKLQNIPSLGL